MSAQQIDVNEIISNTIISVTQNISQTVSASQVLSVNCTKNQQDCNDCVKWWVNKYKEANRDPIDAVIAKNCKYACECSVTNLNMSQAITCNFGALVSTVSQNTFFDSFKSNLYIYMHQRDSYIPGLGSPANMEVVQKKVNAVFSELKDDKFQQILQSLETSQIVEIEGPSSVTKVTMKQMVNIVSNATQGSQSVNAAINDLESTLMTMTKQVIDAGLNQLIASLLMIIAIIVIFIILFFICQNVITLIPSLLL